MRFNVLEHIDFTKSEISKPTEPQISEYFDVKIDVIKLLDLNIAEKSNLKFLIKRYILSL